MGDPYGRQHTEITNPTDPTDPTPANDDTIADNHAAIATMDWAIARIAPTGGIGTGFARGRSNQPNRPNRPDPANDDTIADNHAAIATMDWATAWIAPTGGIPTQPNPRQRRYDCRQSCCNRDHGLGDRKDRPYQWHRDRIRPGTLDAGTPVGFCLTRLRRRATRASHSRHGALVQRPRQGISHKQEDR